MLLLVAVVLAFTGTEPVAQEPRAPGGAPDAVATGDVRRSADTDAEAQEQLRAILARIPALDEIDASVAAGVVSLSGRTVDADAAAKAAELAARLDGVVYVDNRIETVVDPWARLTPQWGRFLDAGREFVAFLPLLAVAILVFAASVWFGRWLATQRALLGRFTRHGLIQGILGTVLRTVTIGIGLFLALEILDATALVGAILGTAGVIGLALGFAFRDIVENYLASIILSFRQPFDVKDLVEIDGKMGTVIRMTTRETVLMTADGNHLRLPNATVFKSVIENYSTNHLRRFSVAVGIGTDEDIQNAQGLGLDVLTEMSGVVADPPPTATVEELGDSNVSVRFFGWVDQTQTSFVKVRSEATRLIKEIMDEHGIDMPEPSYRVRVERAARGGAAPERVPTAGATRERARDVSVEIDDHLDRQVEEEIRRGEGEGDILEKPSVAAAPAQAGQ